MYVKCVPTVDSHELSTFLASKWRGIPIHVVPVQSILSHIDNPTSTGSNTMVMSSGHILSK